MLVLHNLIAVLTLSQTINAVVGQFPALVAAPRMESAGSVIEATVGQILKSTGDVIPVGDLANGNMDNAKSISMGDAKGKTGNGNAETQGNMNVLTDLSTQAQQGFSVGTKTMSQFFGLPLEGLQNPGGAQS